MDHLPYLFAIIGGGLTATSLLCQIVDKLSAMGGRGRQLSRDFALAVFEQKDVFGPGLPHNKHYVLPFHITNMCAKDMGVLYHKPTDFQDWVYKNQDILETQYSNLNSACENENGQMGQCCHYPRAIMGEYLKSRFAGAVEMARKMGISVMLYDNSEVTDLCESDGRICLTVHGAVANSAAFVNVDGVLLATGHWFKPSRDAHYFTSPWPASELLTAIPSGAKVGVLGSSLSAIEVALTLTSDGNFSRQSSGELQFIPSRSTRRLTLYSRNGILPKVRGRIGRRPNLYLTCSNIRRLIENNPGRLKLMSVFELLDSELKAAYGHHIDWQQIMHPKGDPVQHLRQDIQQARRGDGREGELVWQTLLVEIFPVVRELYLNLALAEREKFDRYFNTLFFMYAATQPITNGEKLLALMQAGIVSLVKLGDDYRFERKTADGQFEFIYGKQRHAVFRDTYTHVVNACGQPRSIESDASTLTHNLLKRELVQIQEVQEGDTAPSYFYTTGSVVVDPETHQVVRPGADRCTLPDLPLFAVGAMTRGQMIDASMAHGIARSTLAVAEGILSRLIRRND